MKILLLSGENLASLTGQFTIDFAGGALGAAGLFAITGIGRAAAAMAFGFLGGWLLDLDLAHYRWLIAGFALSGIVSGLLTYQLPATPWQPPAERSWDGRSPR